MIVAGVAGFAIILNIILFWLRKVAVHTITH
jgi:hypothetical protein